MEKNLPLGKIPPDLLFEILAIQPPANPRVVIGPGEGLDCAVIDLDERLLVLKSDPITFATDEIGWYAVQVNANDVATTGAQPLWFLATILLPEGNTSRALVLEINRQLIEACQALEISLVGGHTEITYGLDRPVIAGTMIGEVAPEKLVTPNGASPGDAVLLTKSIPIEATAILARERRDGLSGHLSEEELAQARHYIHHPGISVVREARLAADTGWASAMHDPTEGGLASALWELAEASGRRLVIHPGQIAVDPLAKKICDALGINPLAAIASGALLLTSPSDRAPALTNVLQRNGIECRSIGRVVTGEPGVHMLADGKLSPLERPLRDELARIFEA